MSLENIRKLRESSEKELSKIITQKLASLHNDLQEGNITLLQAYEEYCCLKVDFDSAAYIIKSYGLLLDEEELTTIFDK